MPLIYEVTLQVDGSLAGEYDVWLREHVNEMRALPGFLGARIFALHEEDEIGAAFARVVQYELAGPEAFRAYLDRDAAHMREQGLRRFGDKVTATRRLLHPRPG